MGLSRERAKAALNGCTKLKDFRRGGSKSFLSRLSDAELMAMPIGDGDSSDDSAGFLDRGERMTSGEV